MPPVAGLPDRQRRIVDQWQRGAYETEAEGHRAFLLGRGRRRGDPTASWLARIVQIGAKPLRDAKAGLKLGADGTAPGAQPAGVAERLAQAQGLEELYRRMGRADDAALAGREAAALRARIDAGEIAA